MHAARPATTTAERFCRCPRQRSAWAPCGGPAHAPRWLRLLPAAAASPGPASPTSAATRAGNALAPLAASYTVVPAALETFAAATVAIGQADLADGLVNRGVGAPRINNLAGPGMADVAPGGTLFVADTNNNRVLAWSQVPNVSGADGVFQLGGVNNLTRSGMSVPDQVLVANGKLFVV